MSNAYFNAHMDPSTDLTAYGWTQELAEAFLPHEKAQPHSLPGRIIAEHRQYYLVQTHAGEGRAQISGRLRYHTQQHPEQRPAVGDWVVLWPTHTARANEVPNYRIQELPPPQQNFSQSQWSKDPGTDPGHQFRHPFYCYLSQPGAQPAAAGAVSGAGTTKSGAAGGDLK